MKVVSIDKKTWTDGIDKALGDYTVHSPVDTGEGFAFTVRKGGEGFDFSFQNTRLSPKSVIYPQSQVMFEYSLDPEDPDHHRMKEPERDGKKNAVVGIRPCDAKAFELVRLNFDAPDYKDPYWIRPYEATTFIGLACNDPCGTCFCTTAGCGPFHEEGLDALAVDTGDTVTLKILTEKGEAFAAAAGWDGAEAGTSTIEELKDKAEKAITSKVRTDKLGDKKILELYEAPFWDDVGFSCINCGTCTYSCPTCWCFDIQDENCGTCGTRMRNWDSCMYPLFTLHGSGHNPRTAKVQRVRQRFMHKLKYYVDKYDAGIQCVGCGRCVRLCPVNIDIRRVCDLMNSFDPEACACPV